MSAVGKWFVMVGFALGFIAAAAELLGFVPLPFQLAMVLPTGLFGLAAVLFCLAGLALRGDRRLGAIGVALGLVPWALMVPALLSLATS